MADGGDLTLDERRALQEELQRLDAKVEKHPALAMTQQAEELDRAMRWYLGNASECLDAIAALNESDLGLRMMADIDSEVPFGDDEFREYVVELGRRWHNFVASAKTFADHMRLQFEQHHPADLQAEYEQKKQELLKPHDVVDFVSRSRNVLLHGRVFQTGLTMKFTQTSMEFEADCRTDILLNAFGKWWTAGARRFIESKAPRLNLEDAIEEHIRAVTPLYEWYRKRVYEYHYPTFAAFEATAARIREVSERLEPGSMPPPVDDGVHLPDPSAPTPVRPPAKPRSKPKPRNQKGRKKKR